MITQTLEWYRFGDKMPELDKLCLVTTWGSEPQVAHLTFDPDDGDRWSSNGYISPVMDDDLWAYWVEPKEEK